MSKQASPVNDLALVIDELFAGARTTYERRNGFVVEFKSAKLPQITCAMKFFQALLDRTPADKFNALIADIAFEQMKLIEAGHSPYDLHINASSLMTKAFGHGSMILGIFASVADLIEEPLSVFTNLSMDEINELDHDELAVVACGVAAVNYSFFSQSLPLILRTALAGWQKKGGVEKPATLAPRKRMSSGAPSQPANTVKRNPKK